jgi:hypothetical protein
MSQDTTVTIPSTGLPTSIYEEALKSLQIYLRVELSTAKIILQVASTQYESEKAYHLIATYFPRVIAYHLAMFQSGEKLHRPNEYGNYKHLLNAYMSSCVSYVDANTSVLCFEFSAEFRQFYENVFFTIIEKKLDTLLFNIQALHEQIGIANFQNTFELLKPLNEAGIVELLDFSWHCKAQRVSEFIEQKNVTAIYSSRARNIPADIQTAIVNQPEFPKRLWEAHDALKNVLQVGKQNRSEIINHLVFENLKLVPKIAEILRKKAVLLKLSPHGYNNHHSFRVGIIYGSIPDDPTNEFFWARRILLDTFDNRFVEMFVSDAMIDRVIKDLPLIRCQNSQYCIDVISQEHNVQQYIKGLEALSFGLPLPHLDLHNTPLLPASSDSYNSFAVGAVGISVALGVGIFVGNSLYRQFGFWGKKLGLTKTNQDKSAMATTVYKTLRQ